MTQLKSLLFAAALFFPAVATAAPVAVYSATGAAQFDGQFFDFFDDGADDIDIFVAVEWLGGMLTGILFVSDFTSAVPLLESESIFDGLLNLQSSPVSATLIFDMLEGSAAGRFGDMVTAEFGFSLGGEDDGVFDPVTVTLYADTVAPIPLPASLGFLMLGLGAVASLKRRRG